MQQEKRSFESSLHDIVYSIDTGTGLKIIRAALYSLFLLVIILVYTATQFRGLKTEEAMDYAQLGRNLSIENGLSTKYLRPLTLWKMGERSPNGVAEFQNHPDLIHPPAYPAFLALGFAFFELIGVDAFAMPNSGTIMPAEQWVVLPANHVFAVLTGLLVFFLGKRLFSREIGFIGMTIYYISDIVWKDSISAVGLSMAAFFVMSSFFLMVVAMLNRRDKNTVAAWAVPFSFSIICAAIAFLTRYITIAVVPGVALFAWLMGGKFRGGTRFAILFLVMFSVLISPWLVRNVKVCGNPMGMTGHTALVGTAKYPDKTLERTLTPEFTFSQTMSLLKAKWINNFKGEYSTVIPEMGGGIMMALFIITFFYHFIRPQVNYLRWGLGVSFAIMLVIAGFFSESSMASLHVFWPFVILYGLALYKILIDRLDVGVRLYTTSLKVLICVLALIPATLAILPPHEGRPYPPYMTPYISFLSKLLTEREIMCSDMPWATAWYGDRISVSLPQTVDDFYKINDNQRNISGLYITALTKNKPWVKDLVSGPEQSWYPILNGRVPADFPLKQIFSPYKLQEMMFFSDRDRWSTASAEQKK